jgi:predicted RNase H-like HicB family nuclease
MVSANPPIRIPLRAVLYREDDWWIAHCLEMDIAAEGNSPEVAFASLNDLCELQLQVSMDNCDPGSAFRFVPDETWCVHSPAATRRFVAHVWRH